MMQAALGQLDLSTLNPISPINPTGPLPSPDGGEDEFLNDQNDSFGDVESIAPTVVAERVRLGPRPDNVREDLEERKGEVPEQRVNPYNDPWTAPDKRTKAVNLARATHLMGYATGAAGLPEIATALRGHKTMLADSLTAAVDAAQEILDRKAADYAGKKYAKEEKKKQPMADAQGNGLAFPLRTVGSQAPGGLRPVRP